MTAQAFMAEHIERMGLSVAHFISATDPEKLTLAIDVPDQDPTRTIFQLVGECAAANRMFASLLRGESPERSPMPEFIDVDAAKEAIIDSSNELADVVRNLSDEGIEKEYSHPVRGSLSGKILMMGAYRNMAYHSGQINFIQILGGDHEFHVPPTWLK